MQVSSDALSQNTDSLKCWCNKDKLKWDDFKSKIPDNASSFGGDQGARWEGLAYERFSYKDGKMNPADKGEVFNHYHKNYNSDKMMGMTLQPNSYYNTLILLGPTPGTGKDTKKVKRAKGTPIPGE